MDKLLNVNELAELLGVQVSTVYQWTSEGFIPYIKLGKFVRFREEAVIAWLEQRSHPGRKTRRIDLKDLNLDLRATKKFSSFN